MAGQSLFMPTDLEKLIVYRRSLDDPNPAPEDVVRVWAEAMVSQEPWIRKMLKEVGTDLVPYSYNRQFTAEFADLELRLYCEKIVGEHRSTKMKFAVRVRKCDLQSVGESKTI